MVAETGGRLGVFMLAGQKEVKGGASMRFEYAPIQPIWVRGSPFGPRRFASFSLALAV